MDETKRTEVAGAGALTLTVNLSPIFIATCNGFVTGVEAAANAVQVLLTKVAHGVSVVLPIPKVAAVGVTTKLFVAVAPNAEAVTVVEPDDAPLTVLVNKPLASVTPEAGVKLTLFATDWVNTTLAFGTIIPAESFAVTVRVAGTDPSSVRLSEVELSVTVEPTI
jgi:hypothetical protein